MSHEQQLDSIVVFGAGGRAGLAIVSQSLRRRRRMIAVVRDPDRHSQLAALGGDVLVVAGDLTDPESATFVVSDVAGGVVALVNAVTPFSAPPESFDDFDANYYVHLTDNLSRAALAVSCRVVEIGLAATLKVGNRRLSDDDAAFPAFLRPFADARLRGLGAWQNQTSVDWLVITPSPGLSPNVAANDRYQLGDDVLDPGLAAAPLAYPDLALAVLDQIEAPTAHRQQITAYGLRDAGPDTTVATT
jgi:putative NADH-flavin reductase